MIHTNVGDLAAGNVLAKQILLEGKNFLPAGAVLTSKQLLILKTWGIKYVWIEGNQNKLKTEVAIHPSTNNQSPSGLIDVRFSKCDQNDWLVVELKRIANTLGCNR